MPVERGFLFRSGRHGFRIEISRIEGKWKLNQNRPPEQRERVVQQLRTLGDENSQAIAELMASGG